MSLWCSETTRVEELFLAEHAVLRSHFNEFVWVNCSLALHVENLENQREAVRQVCFSQVFAGSVHTSHIHCIWSQSCTHYMFTHAIPVGELWCIFLIFIKPYPSHISNSTWVKKQLFIIYNITYFICTRKWKKTGIKLDLFCVLTAVGSFYKDASVAAQSPVWCILSFTPLHSGSLLKASLMLVSLGILHWD